MSNKKNIHLLSFNGTWQTTNNFIPVLWPSAKTFYEKYGEKPEKYNWVLPTSEFLSDFEKIKEEISLNPPDVLGVSLYVWNFELSLMVCQWVKETYPNCLIITGGPHQYFKHNSDWFLKHDFIDASLPSEVYGEIAIADVLNNLKDNNTINWNKVEQMVYPTKDRKTYLRSPKATYKLDFKWNYSAFQDQKEEIAEYIRVFRDKIKDKRLHCKIETTRGCPYECTFCDWGGGVGTKVIFKDIEYINLDFEMLLQYNLASIYVCDANFGIGGQRDLDMVKYIAEKKQQHTEGEFPMINYGGYAKTTKHFDLLKEIFTIEAENGLSYFYKISQQSFNHDILQNIKRTDLRDNEHFDLARYLRKKFFKYDAVVELILGLPGMTTDIWYTEFNKPYEENVLARVYEWHLLPEAEAFEPEYRNKFGIGTSRKLISDHPWSIPAEIVTTTFSYTRKDYQDLITIYTIYLCLMQTGIYKNAIKELLKHKNIKFGDFLKKFHQECYPKIREASGSSLKHFEDHTAVMASDTINKAELMLDWDNDPNLRVILWNYFMLEYFKNFEIIDPIVKEWFIEQGVDKNLCQRESDIIHSEKRMGTSKRSGLSIIKYNNFNSTKDVLVDLDRSIQFVFGNLLLAEKKLLGIFYV
jgi:putative methyltransferase